MKLIPLYQLITIGFFQKQTNLRFRGHGEGGLITYSSLYLMLFMVALALGSLHISALSFSNTIDEMNLVKAHYDAERGARWFVEYTRCGGTWNDTKQLIVENDESHTVYIKKDSTYTNPVHAMSYGIRPGYTARVHIYFKERNDHTLEVVDIKPY